MRASQSFKKEGGVGKYSWVSQVFWAAWKVLKPLDMLLGFGELKMIAFHNLVG